MAYKSSYTGPQIDQAVGNALNKDTSTLSDDVNHIPASSVVKSAFNNLAGGVAIISNGNTHVAILDKQFVYIQGHSTLSDGMYQATQNIAANVTLSASNVQPDSNGALNKLVPKIATVEGTTNSYGLLASTLVFSNTIPISAFIVTGGTSHSIVLLDVYSGDGKLIVKCLDGTNMNPIANASVKVQIYYLDT